MVTLIHLVTVTQNCMKALVHSIPSMRFAAAAAAANSKVAIIVLQYRKENRALGDQSVHHSMLLWKSPLAAYWYLAHWITVHGASDGVTSIVQIRVVCGILIE